MLQRRGSSSLCSCCLYRSTFCHSPFHLSYSLHPHLLARPALPKHVLGLASNSPFPIGMAMKPSPPCLPRLPTLVIKVNCAWIEGKSVPLSLDMSILKAETFQRQFAPPKVPLLLFSFLLFSQLRNSLVQVNKCNQILLYKECF